MSSKMLSWNSALFHFSVSPVKPGVSTWEFRPNIFQETYIFLNPQKNLSRNWEKEKKV